MTAAIRYLLRTVVPRRARIPLLKFSADFVDWITKILLGVDTIWRQDPRFVSLYKELSTTLVLNWRSAYVLYQGAKNCASLNADFAEVGVFRGGSAKIIFEAADRLPQHSFYLFDTFSGLPVSYNDCDKFWRRGGFHDTCLDDVRVLLHQPNFCFVKGVFPDAARELPDNLTFAFVHVDPDLYRPVLDACRFFYPRLVRGGVMFFDDYGLVTCPGVKMAVDEFFKNTPEQPVYLATGQCMVIKQ